MNNDISDIFARVRQEMGIGGNVKINYCPGKIIFSTQWEDILTMGYEIKAGDPKLKWDNKGFVYVTDDGKEWRVHVYIRDQSSYGYRGNPKDYVSSYKFHLTHCSKLEEMHKKGAYSKYVISTSTNGKFKVNLITSGGTFVEEVPDQELKVCRCCLRETNYRNYAHVNKERQDRIVNEFNLSDFYKENPVADIHIKPEFTDVTQPINNYTTYWNDLSANLRKKYNYICQECHRDFHSNPQDLHVHHIDGLKNNNNPSNLIVLCKDCHSKKHPHMQNITKAKSSTKKKINTNNGTKTQKSKFLYFDTETTGRDPVTDDLLQFSIIDDTGKLLYNSYFHPRMKKSWPEAQRVNHISPAMVANAPTFVQERAKIQAIFDEADIVCGYNIGFDKRFLSANGISFRNDIRYIDVLMLARKFVDTTNHRLTTVAQHLGFKFTARAAHDALGDVLATKFIREKLLPVIK